MCARCEELEHSLYLAKAYKDVPMQVSAKRKLFEHLREAHPEIVK